MNAHKREWKAELLILVVVVKAFCGNSDDSTGAVNERE